MKLIDNLYAYPWTQTIANNCNTYLVDSAPGMMLDPGHSQLYGHVETGLSQDEINPAPQLIVLSHSHPDHLEAAAELQGQGARVAIHPVEAQYMDGEGRQLAAALGMPAPELTADIFLEEGELEVGQETFQVIHTPGHSPGHICLYQPRLKALFSGDLVFVQGVGRVDFPGGDGQKLKESIKRVSGLDIEWLLPGHGPILKGAEQVKRNFELIESSYFAML
ncbi:MAG: MBL fold metallo-hydrolase [Desulfarculaceae bacterium]|jgi:glyoxylase-like metal-dependent hydrolase (beta-lactamase superfamily II)